MSAAEGPTIVVDNGSGCIKAGFASDNHPLTIFPSVVGRPASLNGWIGREYYDVYIGDEAATHCDGYALARPIVAGAVINWDDVERLWHRVYYTELRVAPEDRPVLMTCLPLAPITDKYTMCEILFETLNVPAVYISPQCALSLYAAGVTTGVSVDSGYGATDIITLHQGNIIKFTSIPWALNGERVSEILRQKLNERGLDIGTSFPESVEIDQMKTLCYVPETPGAISRSVEWVRADGSRLDLTAEAAYLGEALFNPGAACVRDVSLARAVKAAVDRCSDELQPEVYENVILSGGNSMFPNLPERLRAELQALVDADAGSGAGAGARQRPCVRVVATEDRAQQVFVGGSILASLPDARQVCLSRRNYDEEGRRGIYSRFIT